MQQAQALHRDGQLQAARTLCERQLQDTPGDFDALSLLGLIAAQQGDFTVAVAAYDQVLALAPGSADAYANRGASLAGLNRCEEALANFDQAIAIRPQHAEAHCGRTIVWLLQGDFARGWPEFEWRWKTTYGSVAQARDGLSQVLSDTQPAPRCDVYCPLLSLPLALKIELATIPSRPYLRVPGANLARGPVKLGESKRPRIGLVWRGDSRNPDDWKRSVTLTQILDHLPAGFQYVSLQKELTESEQLTAATHADFRWWQDLNFVDAAALCESLDLVLSVDTSLAHLAAALGRKTWILLPFNPDCRWLLDRKDSPWYPSVTLYRQAFGGDWHGVLTRVAADLNAEFARYGL